MTIVKGKIVTVISCIVVLAILIGGAYWYHKKTIRNMREQILIEQQEAQNQQELLEQRVADIKTKLANSEQENETLISKIEALLTEEVYYFDSATITEEIREIGELATVEYRYTNAATLDASIKVKLFDTDIDLPLTKKTAVVTMDGIIKIGVDLNKIKISSDEKTKTITVFVPNARLLSNELDENSLQIYDEKSGMFNRITLEDSSSLRSQIKEKSEQNAKTNGAYEQAKENAQKILKCIIESVPGLKETYTIKYK